MRLQEIIRLDLRHHGVNIALGLRLRARDEHFGRRSCAEVPRQLAALQNAVKLLAVFPEKKAMIYFSSGTRIGVDNQAQLRATTNAAVGANVAIYPVDSRGLVAVPR